MEKNLHKDNAKLRCIKVLKKSLHRSPRKGRDVLINTLLGQMANLNIDSNSDNRTVSMLNFLILTM